MNHGRRSGAPPDVDPETARGAGRDDDELEGADLTEGVELTDGDETDLGAGLEDELADGVDLTEGEMTDRLGGILDRDGLGVDCTLGGVITLGEGRLPPDDGDDLTLGVITGGL